MTQPPPRRTPCPPAAAVTSEVFAGIGIGIGAAGVIVGVVALAIVPLVGLAL